jgi:hypothetical protein
MARLAFIVGSNGPRGPTLNPLKYAKQDARQFAAALRGPRCGFKVTIATNTKDPFMLRRELRAGLTNLDRTISGVSA